jgi:hypothetical protein
VARTKARHPDAVNVVAIPSFHAAKAAADSNTQLTVKNRIMDTGISRVALLDTAPAC